MRNHNYYVQRFELNRPLSLEVYAIGEVNKDGSYDFSRIINLDSREMVWQLDYRHSEPAGGASKNRFVKEPLRLPEGRYALVAGTDDSHAFKHWNMAPPHDPAFWGVTLFFKNKGDAGFIKRIDGTELLTGKPVVVINNVRDNIFRSHGFSLNKDTDVYIYALGEGRDGEMYDYGWIVDAGNHEKVWKMKFRDTQPAGGADKNRLFDGVLSLPAGNYIAYYVSDGSHAYNDWNADPPFDEDAWGMTLTVSENDFNDGVVSEYDPKNDKNIIASLTRLGDYEKERVKFTLDKETDIRIYALGEGQYGEMYDYGWIRNADTGETVWKMRYRNTENAGGARKNRLVEEVITLEPGEYYLYFKTDDSHSYEKWNDSPPFDPESWGITLYTSGN